MNPLAIATASLTWFCIWQADAVLALDVYELNALQALVSGCPGLHAGHILLPANALDPHYPDQDGSPSLIVQLEFSDVAAFELMLRPDGYLAALADPAFLPSLNGATASQQAMLIRRYPVSKAQVRSANANSLSYWVEYTGPATDPNAWHDHYTRHHPHLLSRFPGIRAIEIYTPAPVVCGLPLPERSCLQRNKTVFDDAEAMNLAMKSPVRAALRADIHSLPPFQGAALHFPFTSISCS